MDIKAKYGWQELYASAPLDNGLVENGRENSSRGEDESEVARFSMNHGGTPEENHAIEDSLNGLDPLRKEVATWQESKRES